MHLPTETMVKLYPHQMGVVFRGKGKGMAFHTQGLPVSFPSPMCLNTEHFHPQRLKLIDSTYHFWIMSLLFRVFENTLPLKILVMSCPRYLCST